MKGIILLLVLSFTLCQVFAQNEPSISITKKGLEWSNVSDRIIEDKENNIVYIGFANDFTDLVLKPKIDASLLNRDTLNNLLSADKFIFIQGYVKDNKTHTTPFKECGQMVSLRGSLLSLSCVRIAKDSLPVSMKFNGKDKEIRLQCFNPDDLIACKTVRKYAFGGKLPEITKDTIELEKLATLRYSTISFKKNNFWNIECKYYVNGEECLTANGSVVMPENISSIIKEKGMLELTYEIKFTHTYFGHTTKGKIAEICVKKHTWSDYTFEWWHLCLLLLIILAVVNKKRFREYIKKHKKDKVEKKQNNFIKRFISSEDSASKLSLISQLLSNVDDGFKKKLLSILDIDPIPPTPVLPETTKVPDSSPIIKELKKKIENQVDEIRKRSTQIEDNEKTITTLQNGKTELSLKLGQALKDNKTLTAKNSELNKKVRELNLEINSLNSIIANKDKQIEQYLQKNKVLKDQLAHISRQNMYLLQIDDVLKEISDDILVAFEEVEDGELKKKLVLPLLNGVTGLDEGLTTYYKRWQEQVMKVQYDFFGRDLYEMSDDEVKKKLTSGFLKNLAQGDTFSKLTRLYMYIQADWINEILIKNKFNVDKIEQIFNRLKMLFNDFGIEIIYPRLFVDRMNEQQYTFDPRCEVFKLFPISEDMRMSYSTQTDLIIDIVQIGVKIPAEQYSRKAIVSIPNF